jgi:hypothetical protein
MRFGVFPSLILARGMALRPSSPVRPWSTPASLPCSVKAQASGSSARSVVSDGPCAGTLVRRKNKRPFGLPHGNGIGR